jgi:type IV pilus assembly protein PilW
MQHRSRGFSLVELMVAVALATITGLVVLQVLSNFQTRRQTTTGHNDAEINASLGMFAMEREVRMAGAGLTTPSGLFCGIGYNESYGGATASDGLPLQPLRIVDGGAGPDRIDTLRSDSAAGGAPSTVLQLMVATTSDITVDGTSGLAANNLFMVGNADGSKLCTLMQLSAAPVINGSSWNLPHASGAGFPYNPPDPTAAFTTAIRYDVRDSVINMGTRGWRSYAVVCSDGGVPAATNNCDLGTYNTRVAPNPVTLADIESLAPQVIELQAQYGIAVAGTQAVNQWVDATGAWANPSILDMRRIKAVRIALVARGNREATAVTPGPLILWDATLASERSRVLSAAEQRYRYQVLTIVVPLVNIIWAGV